jgi:hypothetical protein
VLSATDDRVLVGVTGAGVDGEVGSLADPTTGIAACVTIVREAPDAGSVRLNVNMPTAATSPVVVCANRRIENVPVTCVASASGAAGVGVVGGTADGVCCVSGGVVGSGVVGGVVGSGVVGSGAVGGVVGSGVVGSGGVAGAVGVVGLVGVASVPVIGMISLPDDA